jgi:hypothetical protein
LETYRGMRQSAEVLATHWPDSLLPFCEWGGQIQSCVDCKDSTSPVYLTRCMDSEPQGYDLDKFVEMWIEGVDILELDPTPTVSSEFTNPFTGKKRVIKSRAPRNMPTE